MSEFKDYFSKQSEIYARYRPKYPEQLYSYLANLSGADDLAWDAGTGNGQAACGLSDFYKRVIATDPSESQIRNAIKVPNVEYRIEKAEQTSLENNSVDLLTVANALHWFDFEAFYKEARRVLKKGSVIAAWCYGRPAISDKIDELLLNFHDQIVGPYWLAENKLVEKEYKTIPFPFDEIKAPELYSTKLMSRKDLIGYLNTWSATQRFISDRHYNPTEGFASGLQELWNDATEKMIRWKLVLKIGRL